MKITLISIENNWNLSKGILLTNDRKLIRLCENTDFGNYASNCKYYIMNKIDIKPKTLSLSFVELGGFKQSYYIGNEEMEEELNDFAENGIEYLKNIDCESDIRYKRHNHST